MAIQSISTTLRKLSLRDISRHNAFFIVLQKHIDGQEVKVSRNFMYHLETDSQQTANNIGLIYKVYPV